MVHKLDFSRSGAAITDLFPTVNASGTQVMPAEYWTQHGLLSGQIRYYVMNHLGHVTAGLRPPAAPPGAKIETRDIFLRPFAQTAEIGALTPDFLDSLDQGPIVAPPEFQAARDNFSFGEVNPGASGGSYMTLVGVKPVRARYGPGLNTVFNDIHDAEAAAQGPLTTALLQNLAADLEAIEARLLSGVSRIRMQRWSGDPADGIDQTLVYTPDRKSQMTIGQLVDFNGPHSAANAGHVNSFDQIFAGEDLDLLLTRFDDSLDFALAGIQAEHLVIRTLAGHDTVNLPYVVDQGGSHTPTHLPKTVLIDGGAGADHLMAGALERLELLGGAGNDTLWGSGARVLIRGGDGHDEIWVQDGATTLYGGNGNDTISGGMSADTIHGDAGHDLIRDAQISTGVGAALKEYISSAVATFYGGAGNDTIDGGGGSDLLYGGDGRDQLYGAQGDDQLYGGAGDDGYWHASGGTDRYLWASGDTTVHDTGGMILLFPEDPGRSMLTSRLTRVGQDLIIGEIGEGSLRIVNYYRAPDAWTSGQLDADGPIRNSRLVDWAAARALRDPGLLGGAAADTLTMARPGVASGGAGHDRITGTARADILFGDAGQDSLLGGAGNDRLVGGLGRDRLLGGAGADTLVGNDGDDRLEGGDGRDLLWGGAGQDNLLGGKGDDTLVGGAGNDRIIGGAGQDLLYGGLGADIFVFGRGAGRDQIRDFEPAGAQPFYSEGSGDRLHLSADLWRGTLTARQVVDRFAEPLRDGLILDFGSGDTLELSAFTSRAALIAAIDIIG